MKFFQKKKKFCSRPFEWLEVNADQCVHFCCPAWLKKSGIAVGTRSIREIWNSPEAQELRASILDGSFRYCRKEECFFMNTEAIGAVEKDTRPYRDADDVTDGRLREIIANGRTVLADGPWMMNCAYDLTCNLSCPSCRSQPYCQSAGQSQQLIEFQRRIFAEIGKELFLLYIAGKGEPFASPVYWGLLRSLSSQTYPRLKIHLATNGLLWTRDNWDILRNIQPSIHSANISIDAASATTYLLNRRGADWDVLMSNLRFLAELRQTGRLGFVMASFVVQQNNFREMPAFISLMEQLGFDLVCFQKLGDWGTYPPGEYETRAVHLPGHPEHGDFLRVLGQDCFARPHVSIYSLWELRKKALLLKRVGPKAFLVWERMNGLLSAGQSLCR